jgi:hypothetical protein
MSRTRKAKPAKQRKSATSLIPASELHKLEVMEKRLQRARHVVHCVEFAATAEGGEIELGPVAFVAVDLIDRALDDLAVIVSCLKLPKAGAP